MSRIQITKRAADWLSTTTNFRMLHDFEQVVNLINDRGEVLAVHTTAIGMGPFSLQVDQKDFQRMKSTSVGGDEDGFKWAELRQDGSALVAPYDMNPDILWDARPNWKAFSSDSLTDIDHKLSPAVEQVMNNLHCAIFENNLEQISIVTQQLVGRGVGLTPTGDDVLIGTLYALHVLGSDQETINLIGKQTIGRTTSLSAAFLQAAVAGEATEPWHRLLNGETNALAKILSVGATSGRDAWVGFIRMVQASNNLWATENEELPTNPPTLKAESV